MLQSVLHDGATSSTPQTSAALQLPSPQTGGIGNTGPPLRELLISVFISPEAFCSICFPAKIYLISILPSNFSPEFPKPGQLTITSNFPPSGMRSARVELEPQAGVPGRLTLVTLIAVPAPFIKNSLTPSTATSNSEQPNGASTKHKLGRLFPGVKTP